MNRKPSRLQPCPIDPCLPRRAETPPSGPGWVHEIKHDGFRIVARRTPSRVRLYTRNGYCFADRFSLIVDAIASLPVKTCTIDGEAIVVNADGLSVFDLLRYRQHDSAALLCVFDLIEVDGEDLRWAKLEYRKAQLAELLADTHDGIALNAHFNADGPSVFEQACALGCAI